MKALDRCPVCHTTGEGRSAESIVAGDLSAPFVVEQQVGSGWTPVRVARTLRDAEDAADILRAGGGVYRARERVVDQPAPKPNTKPAVWDLVIDDMKERDRVGRERYGTPLQPFNGRNALVDAYQEALDLVVYLRQRIEEDRAIERACQNCADAERVRNGGR